MVGMATYIVPGVFVEETKRGPNPIEGVATGTAGFLGAAVRGPVRPVLVTSEAEYFRWFGGPVAGESYLQEAVRGFFVNGGRRLYVTRMARPHRDVRAGARRAPLHAKGGRAGQLGQADLCGGR